MQGFTVTIQPIHISSFTTCWHIIPIQDAGCHIAKIHTAAGIYIFFLNHGLMASPAAAAVAPTRRSALLFTADDALDGHTYHTD